MRTEITQPAVLAVDIALTRLLAAYGIVPDFVMGHSLGEYGALVAAGALTFEEALEAVSARGREMASLHSTTRARWPRSSRRSTRSRRSWRARDGYVVLANVNSTNQVVLGGATEAVERAVAALTERGHQAIQLPVSHAFHTEIVAPASEPLRDDAAAPRLRATADPDRGQRRRRVLPVRPERGGADGRHPRPSGRLAGAVRQGPANAVRRGRARVRRDRPQACAPGLCLRRARRERGAEPVHQPPEARRPRLLQPGALRLCGSGEGLGSRTCPRRRPPTPGQPAPTARHSYRRELRRRRLRSPSSSSQRPRAARRRGQRPARRPSRS